MSKKLILLGTALLLLLAGLFFPHSRQESPLPPVQQHLSAPGASAETSGFDAQGILTSHLPLVILHPDGNVIPGQDWEDSRRLTCAYTVIDHENGVNRSTDAPTLEGLTEVNIRGNSSREFPKKQYGLHLVDGQGNKTSAPLLGMPEGSSWVLNGSWIDRSMLRNYMMYNLCGQFMPYSPRVRFCEVFVTNADKEPVYQGVYTLIEKIRVEDDRVRLSDYDPKYTAAPFLLQLNNNVGRNHFPQLTMPEDPLFSYNVEYPSQDEVTPQSLAYIEGELLTLEKRMLDSAYTGDWSWLEQELELDSFVDYYLISEFFQNYDIGSRSTFLYRDLDGKYHLGPVWDFDGVCNNYTDTVFPVDQLKMANSFYFKYLARGPVFPVRCAQRYEELRKSWLNEEYLLNYIDETTAWLDGPGRRNSQLWYGDPAAFRKDADKMKDYIKRRGAWMDANFVRGAQLAS